MTYSDYAPRPEKAFCLELNITREFVLLTRRNSKEVWLW